jgi:hypothetical protein
MGQARTVWLALEVVQELGRMVEPALPPPEVRQTQHAEPGDGGTAFHVLDHAQELAFGLLDGDLIRELTLDPSRDYQPHGRSS